jgi:hypothetical protein
MPRFGFLFTQHGTKPPTQIQYGLKFLLNNTKSMTMAFFLKDIQIGFFFVQHCTKSPPVIQYGIKFGSLLNKVKSMATPSGERKLRLLPNTELSNI